MLRFFLCGMVVRFIFLILLLKIVIIGLVIRVLHAGIWGGVKICLTLTPAVYISIKCIPSPLKQGSELKQIENFKRSVESYSARSDVLL